MKEKKKLVVVLGMHRSGTSVVTRGLQTMGVDLGDNLMPPVPGNNDLGFWEDLDINALNIKMLNFLDTEWYYLAPIQRSDVNTLVEHGYVDHAVELLRTKMTNSEVFGFKDPRTAKLLPFWQEVFRQGQFDVDYVITIRHPLSVCLSLAKRDGFDIERGAFLWLEHLLGSLVETSEKNRVLVDYDQLMRSPEVEMRKMAGKFHLPIDPVKLDEFTQEFLNENFRHTVFQLDDLGQDEFPQLIREVYTDLLNTRDLDSSNMNEMIRKWTSEFAIYRNALVLVDNVTSKAVSLEKSVAYLEQTMETKERQLLEKERLLNEILQSKSWKLILYLRRIRLAIIPSGSWLERMAQSIWKGLRIMQLQGLRVVFFTILDRLFGNTTWYEHMRKIRRAHFVKERRKFRQIAGLPLGLQEIARKIRELDIFDYEWYLNDNPTIQEAGVDPIEHYLLHGIQEERNPTPLFNTSIYAKAFGIPKEDALVHFAESGRLFAPGAYRTAEILMAAQRRYQEGLKMTSIKEKRSGQKKYAVYFQCGAGSIHDKWLSKSDKDWDLIVNHYDRTHLEKIPCDVEFLQTGTNPGTKFTSFAMLLSNWQDLIASYEYVLLLDDDILISENDLSRLFQISSQAGLDCAQASLTPDSFCAHPVVKNPGSTGIRFVNTVEIMMPLLSQSTLDIGGHLFAQTISGWGLDMAISKFIGDQRRIAVIDDVVAQHTKSINLENGAFYKMLHDACIYPEIELTHLQRIHGLGRSLYEVTPNYNNWVWSRNK